MAGSSTLRKQNASSPKSRDQARNRIKDARIALRQPAKEIARKSRARYIEAEKPQRIPSRKPRLIKKPNLKVRRKEMTLAWGMRAFAVLVIVSIFVVVSIQTTIARKQIEIDSLKKQQRAELERFEKTRNEIAQLKSPERIIRRAEHLGLVQPTRFINVSVDMPVSQEVDTAEDDLWLEVKAIIDGSS